VASRIVAMADEVTRLDPSLWLETMFLAESWLARRFLSTPLKFMLVKSARLFVFGLSA